MNKLTLIFLALSISLISISLISSLPNDNNNQINFNYPTNINYSSVNTNNSQYLQGLTPIQVANLFTEQDPNYFSNPRNYVNQSTVSLFNSSYVPYTGATSNINLGDYNITTKKINTTRLEWGNYGYIEEGISSPNRTDFNGDTFYMGASKDAGIADYPIQFWYKAIDAIGEQSSQALMIYRDTSEQTQTSFTPYTSSLRIDLGRTGTPFWDLYLKKNINLAAGSNIILDTATGTKIGTATNQKLAFFNSAPIVQPTATTDLGTVLSNLGLRATGTAYPLTTSGNVRFTGRTNITNLNVTNLNTTQINFTGDIYSHDKAFYFNTTSNNLNISGNININGNLSVKRPYWNGYDNSTQNFLNTENAQVINISNNNNFDSYGIHVVGNKNLTFDREGDYICFLSPEFFQNGGGSLVTFWIQKNGVDVPWTNSRYTMTNNEYHAPTITYQFDINNPLTDNIRFMWWSDSTNTQIYSSGVLTSPSRPSIPGILLNCQRVSDLT